jgi:hypothetical protein
VKCQLHKFIILSYALVLRVHRVAGQQPLAGGAPHLTHLERFLKDDHDIFTKAWQEIIVTCRWGHG